MTTSVPTLADLLETGVEGRTVLVRSDLNVPLDGGKITDAGRIVASAPTIKALSDAGAKVIVTAHLGRPKGVPDPAFSLAPVAERLGTELGRNVQLAGDVVGGDALARSEGLTDGDVLLVENVRFDPRETSKDAAEREKLAKALVELTGDEGAFVSDGFGVVHREQASVYDVAKLLPHYAGGLASIAEVTRRRFLRHRADVAAAAPVTTAAIGGGIAANGVVEVDPNGGDMAPEAAIDPKTGRPRKFAYPPNLFVVDGGAPQVHAAAAVLDELNITDVAVIGLAKRLEEVWVPGDDDPVIFPRTSEALFLLQRVRDEAHRFAISFHRSKRSKRMTASALDGVPGLGATRRAALVAHFGSVANLRQATIEQISEVPGIGQTTARAVQEALVEHNQGSEQTGSAR